MFENFWMFEYSYQFWLNICTKIFSYESDCKFCKPIFIREFPHKNIFRSPNPILLYLFNGPEPDDDVVSLICDSCRVPQAKSILPIKFDRCCSWKRNNKIFTFILSKLYCNVFVCWIAILTVFTLLYIYWEIIPKVEHFR